MSEGRIEEDFSKFMGEQKIVVEEFLCNFEASITQEVIIAIGSGKGNMMKLCQNLIQLFEHYGDMDAMRLSEPQLFAYRLQTSEQLARHQNLLKGLSRLCIEIYRKHADDYFETTEESLQRTFGMQLQLIRFITGNLHNFTDCGLAFCLALSEIDFLFKDFVNPMLIHWLDKHTAQAACGHIINSALGITYNMFRLCDSTIYNRLTQLQVVEPAMPYLGSSNISIQVQALVLIAFALDESKSKFYESASATEVMQFLVSGLQESLTSPDRRYQGYHTSELSVCLNRLALNEVNKELLVKLGILPVLHTMCCSTAPNTAGDVAAALDILFTLSFKEENRPLILKQFLQVLEKLFACPDTNNHTGGLWRNYNSMQGLDVNLSGRISAKCPSVATPAAPGQQSQPHHVGGQNHVMISYQHEQKELVLRIKEALVRNGVAVSLTSFEPSLESKNCALNRRCHSNYKNHMTKERNSKVLTKVISFKYN